MSGGKAKGQLEAMPGLGHLHESPDSRLVGVHVWAVRNFPNHLVFYRPSPNGIEVLHVLHAARDIDVALTNELSSGDL
ncbi:MAG TPA: type II toxin-antitoxin system RelE/ParE family toxin [Tepidisphaeraceae bacterium]|nr:type II toxin-antitoxin system RelE/ParE family toxin [Tepidisphaeraceae bacterium]